jgi:prephenate dehydrogenase
MAFTVVVVGVGLIGGSFALAVRRAGLADRVLGVSSPATLEKARNLGVIDEGLLLEEAVPQADLVLLSATIHSIIETIPRLSGLVKQHALVTDAGSTKRAIMHAAEAAPGLPFIGGHPMAGKELSGVEQAEASLFEGRPWVLTPPRDTDEQGVTKLQTIVEAIGARPLVMPAEEHDAVVARTSHLPQLLSTALAASLDGHFGNESPVLAGPGLIDATRLALSPYSVWKDILDTNRDEITQAMSDFLEQWKEQHARLADNVDLRDQFGKATGFARRLRQ